MKTDTTTKLLLGALTLGVWGLLLKPTVQPIQAQGATTEHVRPSIAVGGRGVYVAENGRIYRFVETPGQPVDVGEYGPSVRPRK